MFPFKNLKDACAFHVIYCSIVFFLFHYYFGFIVKICCFIIGVTVASVSIGVLSLKITRRICFRGKINPRNKAVLITGCDRGFGHYLTERLLSKGYMVFAGCLFPSQADVLDLHSKYSNMLHIFKLDVTNDESVKEAFDFVKNTLNSYELWAVVNNAGILKGFHSEFSTIQEYKDCLEVNCLGIVRVTLAFLPLVKKSRGRIVNMTSFAGRSALTTVSPYVTSKYAAVGFNDCLRHELNETGIRVIAVEPDYFRTKLVSLEGLEIEINSMITSLPPDVRDDYGEDFFTEFKQCRKALLERASPDYHKVIYDLEHAISCVYPEDVYRPCGLLQSIPYIWLYETMTPTFQNLFMKLCLHGPIKPKRLLYDQEK